MGADVVGDDEAPFFDARLDGVEIVDVFVFSGVEEGHIEAARRFGDYFRSMAQNLLNVL